MPAVPLAVAAALVEFGVPIGVSIAATQTAIAIGTSLALSAVSSAIARSKQPSLGASGSNISAVNAPEVRGSIKQDIPPHRIWIGQMRAGGVVYFYKVVPPFLYIGLIHSLLPITSVDRVFVGSNELTFRTIPDGTVIQPLPIIGQPSYNTHLQVCFQFGSLSQPTNQLLRAAFPDLDLNYRLPGIANSVWQFNYGSDFEAFQTLWGNVQIPDAQIVASGCPLPDPREPTHRLDFDPNDISDLYDAMSTWRYSNNASLAQAFHAAMPFGLNAGPSAVYGRDELKRSADFDDELVGLAAGGFQKRHTIDGIITLDQKPLSIMESMITANGGFVSTSGGAVRVVSSQPRDAVATIRDADIMAWSSFNDSKAKRDLVNTATVDFVSPESNYQDAQTQWPDQVGIDAMVAEDGEVYEQSLRLGLTAGHQRAQRRLKHFIKTARLGKALVLVCKPRLFGVVEGDIVRLHSVLYPSVNGLYSVETWQIPDGFSGIAFQLSEHDPALARDWVPSVDEQPFSIDPSVS